MNQEEIKKILPHRDNMLLVEESETVDETTAAKILAGTLAPEEDPQILAAINALKS